MKKEQAKTIIFFDGLCNLCSWTVQFIIKRDKKKTFMFASLQSDFAKKTIPSTLQKSSEYNTIVILMNGKFYTESDSVIQIAKRLSGLWPILYSFIILPKPIRDYLYKIVARYRYNWFGKKEKCYIPVDNEKKLFYE